MLNKAGSKVLVDRRVRDAQVAAEVAIACWTEPGQMTCGAAPGTSPQAKVAKELALLDAAEVGSAEYWQMIGQRCSPVSGFGGGVTRFRCTVQSS